MAPEPKPPAAGEFADLDDEIVVKFKPGEYGQVLVKGLTDLVKHYADAEKQDHILGFLNWVPPDHLERYLVHALEHGADLTRPKGPKKVAGRNGHKKAGRRGG